MIHHPEQSYRATLGTSIGSSVPETTISAKAKQENHRVSVKTHSTPSTAEKMKEIKENDIAIPQFHNNQTEQITH